MPPKKVMVTGVYGLIAGAVYHRLVEAPDRYDVYGLARRRQDSDRVAEGRALEVPEEKFVLSDLSDLDQVQGAMEGRCARPQSTDSIPIQRGGRRISTQST